MPSHYDTSYNAFYMKPTYDTEEDKGNMITMLNLCS